ncbi:hypothetical protein CY34DRAFT_803751 [Suillus luteus UH-Slu-Lm8-n1]|uniref:Uncharacterized protein n=1 Tax=Suillus luteus UH-Slu-Lm8-n1 TaxID=930992 RepID=A0A0D0BJV8_9AGAM|nr:hypothetical protein CY34DRAFT_803751 [Suillus luteus UH-Slu-Lm8-n1]
MAAHIPPCCKHVALSQSPYPHLGPIILSSGLVIRSTDQSPVGRSVGYGCLSLLKVIVAFKIDFVATLAFVDADAMPSTPPRPKR